MTPTEWKRLPRAEKDRLRALKHERRRQSKKTIVVRIERKHSPHPSGCLAGTELKKLFGTIGLKPKANCNCNKHARKMDEAGCDWCEQHIDRIAGWIKYECRKMGIPFVKLAVVTAIRLAISRARKNQSSGGQQTEPQPRTPTD